MQGERAQVQGVSIVNEEAKGSAYGKATKGTASRKTGISCKGKSTGVGKEVEEGRRK